MMHSRKHLRNLSGWLCGALLGLASGLAATPAARGDDGDNPCLCDDYDYFVGCAAYARFIAPEPEEPPPESVVCVGACVTLIAPDASVSTAVENWRKGCPPCEKDTPYQKSFPPPDPPVTYQWDDCSQCEINVPPCCDRPQDQLQLPAHEPCERIPTTEKRHNVTSSGAATVTVTCTVTGHPPEGTTCIQGPWDTKYEYTIVFVAATLTVETCTDTGKPMEVIVKPTPATTPKGDLTTLNCLQFQYRWKGEAATPWPTNPEEGWLPAGYTERVRGGVREYVHTPLSPGYYQFRARNGCCDEWHTSGDQTLVLFNGLVEEKPAVCLGDPIKITADWDPETETSLSCDLKWEYAYKSPTDTTFSAWGAVSMTAPLPGTDDYPHVFTYTPTETGWYMFRARCPDEDANTDWSYTGEIKVLKTAFTKAEDGMCWAYHAVYDPSVSNPFTADTFDKTDIVWSYTKVMGDELESFDPATGRATLGEKPGVYKIKATPGPFNTPSTANAACSPEMTLTTYAIVSLMSSKDPLGMGVDKTAVITATTFPGGLPVDFSIIGAWIPVPVTGDMPPGTCRRQEMTPAFGNRLGCQFGAEIPPSSRILHIDSEKGDLVIMASMTGIGCAQAIKVRITCPGGDCMAGLSAPSMGVHSLDFRVGLGKGVGDRRDAGSLTIDADEPSPLLATPVLLKYGLDDPAVEVIRDPETQSVLRQVLAPQTLADIVTLNDFKYEIRFYHAGDAGAKNEDGLYQPGGVPFVVYAIENPDAAPDIYNRLRITTTKDGNGEVSDFVYTAATGTWELTRPGGLRVESVTSQWDVGLENRQETRIVKDGLGTVFVKSVVTSHQFPWGQCPTLAVSDPDGVALTTTWTYYENAAETHRYGKVKSVSNPDGAWEITDYDATGRKAKFISSWLDVTLADATEANARRLEYDYTPLDAEDTVESYDNRPRTVSEYIEDVLVSRTFHVYKTVGGEEIEITERAATQAAAYGDAGNLRSVVTRYPESAAEPQAQEIKSSLQPDGRLDSYTHELGTFTRAADPAACTFTPGAGTDVRTTVIHGTATSPAGIAFKTTKETTVSDRFNNNVMSETFAYTSAGYARLDWTVTDFDEFGHPTHVYRANGTESEAQWGSAGCCGKTSEKDETGIEKAFGYDLLHRLDTETKIGAGGQPNVVTTFTYDAAGRQLSATRSAGGLSLLAETSYDLAGRAVSATDEAGLVTTTAYADGGRTVTVTRPGGATEITANLLDGRTASVTGTGVVPQHHEYGVNADGTQWTTVYTGAADSPMWEKTTTDFLGRTIKTEKPAFDGSTAASESSYDTVGRLARTTQPGLVPTLYVYDELGNMVRSGLDADGNGTLNLFSNERINDSETVYAQDAGAWWQVTTSTTYPTANDDTPLVTGTQKTRLTGFAGNVTAETIALDIRGNVTTSTTETDRTAKAVTQSTVVPTSTVPTVSTTVNGLMTSTTSPTGLTITYAYDALERQTGVTDPRTGTSVTHYNALGQVDWTEDAAGNRTSYTYEPTTGRRICLTDAAGHTSYTSYTSHGLVSRTWGDTPYPLEYVYDGYGRMTQLKTFRGGSAWDGATWPAAPGTPDVTTWTYQESTGLLTAKTYADAHGTTYTYDDAGRLATRTWSRLVVPPLGGPGVPLVTTYAYSSTTGEQTGIYYSDSTPDVTYTHTRSGQVATVTDACGTRTFDYTAQLELGAETLPPNFYGDKILTRTRDALGRDTGFLLGTAADPDADQDVAYAYDATGRFAFVSASVPSVLSVSYSYLANSDLLETTTLPGNITVTRVYEANRNLIDYVENKAGATTVSKYDYTNDAIARRTARAQSGTAFNAADTVTYGYNTRNEVISAAAAADPAYDFAYAYDPIGNRQTYTNDGNPATNYTTNSLNQYTTISGLTNPSYDLDGNMTRLVVPPSGGPDWALTWDGENRLIAAETPTARIEFTYDYMSRRVEKRTYSGTVDAWTLDSKTCFVYDGWNLILEFDAKPSTPVILKTYTWGLDLSQSLQGAGGIGGLLAVRDAATSETYWALCDANGNLSEYLAASDSSVAAHYEYDPFGGTTLATGAHAADFAHRFSTKFLDAETTLYYYGYRFLNTEMGRWVSRDPIEENGGTGLYHFAGNAPTDRYDFLGLEWTITRHYESDADARCTCGDTVDDLAQKIRLAPAEFPKWLSAVDGKGLPSSSSEKFTADRHFKIPNEAHITQGNLTPDDVFGPVFANTGTRKDGYKTAFMKEKYAVIDHFTSGVAGNSLSEINGALSRDTIAVWAHFGHGHYVATAYGLGLGIPVTWYAPSAFKAHHRLSKVVMYACHQAALKAQWMALVAPGGTLRSTHSSIDPSKPDWYNLFYDSNP